MKRLILALLISVEAVLVILFLGKYCFNCELQHMREQKEVIFLLQLNYGDRRPLYEQIKEKMKEMIVSQNLAENEKIPSVREMAGELAINPNTIQKAYKELEAEGYIYSQKAKGYFVMPMKQAVKDIKAGDKLTELENILKELKYLGTDEKQVFEVFNKIYYSDSEK